MTPPSTPEDPPPLTNQLEFNFDPPANPQNPSIKPEEIAQVSEMVGRVVNALGEVVGDAVGDALADVLERIEHRQAQDRENLARSFEVALERQDARFREALEQQASSFAAAMERQSEVQNEALRTILQDVLGQRATRAAVSGDANSPITETLADLQETLRLGFGEVRAALDRQNRELMEVVRAELRPLAKAALAHLTPHVPGRALIPSAPRAAVEPLAANMPASARDRAFQVSQPSPPRAHQAAAHVLDGHHGLDELETQSPLRQTMREGNEPYAPQEYSS